VFPRKLYEILDNESEDVIAWTDSGCSFVIKDMETFVTSVLMKYFRHQKFSSFQRQLNLYGFRKISKGTETGAYCHEYFARNQTEKLRFVRRTPQVTGRSKAKTDGHASDTSVDSSKQCRGVAQVAKSAISRLSTCCKAKHTRSDSAGSATSNKSSSSSLSSSSSSSSSSPSPSSLNAITSSPSSPSSCPPASKRRGSAKPAKIQIARVASRGGDEEEAPVAHASPVDPVLTSQPTLTYSESDSDDSLLRAFAPLGVKNEDSLSPVTSQPGVFGVELEEEQTLLSAFSFDMSDLSVSVNRLDLGAPTAGACPPAPREPPAPAARSPRSAGLATSRLPVPKLMPASSAVSSLGFDIGALEDQLDTRKGPLDFGDSLELLDPDSAKSRGRSLSLSSDDWALEPPRDGGQLPLEAIFSSSATAGLAPAAVLMER